MRQGQINCINDNATRHTGRPKHLLTCQRSILWSLKSFSVVLMLVLQTDTVFARATVGIESTSSAGNSASKKTISEGERYAPKRQPTQLDEPKILLAHAIIVKTSPPQGGVAPGNIGKVDVWYDAGIRDSLAALAVVSASGERIDKRDAAIDSADPAHVSVGVNPMTPGKYTVRYRALSADGHMVSGAWEFDVQH